MRAWRKKRLHFGLVDIPVDLVKTSESHALGGFHYWHSHKDGGGGRVNQAYRCQECREIFSISELDRCHIDAEGHVIVLSADESADLKVEEGPLIEIMYFCHSSEVDSSLLDGSAYFLAPSVVKGQASPGNSYAMFRKALVDMDQVAVVYYTASGKAHQGIVKALERPGQPDIMVLYGMYWEDEVRDANQLSGIGGLRDVEITVQEEKMARLLVETMQESFKHGFLQDEAKAKVEEFVTARHDAEAGMSSEAPVELDTGAGGAEIDDLLAKLTASIETRKREKARSKADHPAGKQRAPAKKVQTKRAPARRRVAS